MTSSGGLRAVLKAGAEPAPRAPVGHLTTMARAEWAATRAELIGHPGNAAAVDDIETALFCVCLEDFAPADTQEACDHLLYGDSGNRWFDKAVSLIVFADGRAGINVEHCGLDGTTILSFVDALLGATRRGAARLSGARSQGAPAPEPLRFELDDALRSSRAPPPTRSPPTARATATRRRLRRLRRRHRQGARNARRRVRAAGLPARPPARQGA